MHHVYLHTKPIFLLTLFVWLNCWWAVVLTPSSNLEYQNLPHHPWGPHYQYLMVTTKTTTIRVIQVVFSMAYLYTTRQYHYKGHDKCVLLTKLIFIFRCDLIIIIVYNGCNHTHRYKRTNKYFIFNDVRWIKYSLNYNLYSAHD